MDIQKFEFDDLYLITPKLYPDERGFFCERYKETDFHRLGIKDEFIQDNFSRSRFNVLRGMHYQSNPAQTKMITCVSGKIQDVVVDLRKNKSTFGKHQSVILSGEKPQWFYVPAGFAHGFLVVSPEGADVIYKVNTPYTPSSEGSILWNDPALNIHWEKSHPNLSPKDQLATPWKEFLDKNPF